LATCTSTTPTMSAFTAQRVREWLGRVGVKTLFIEPGSPWENGYVESFNGKLRDELLARDTRRRIAEKFGHDLAAIVQDAQKRQATSGHEIWRPKPKPSAASPNP
jgi:transposase InsO family protein